MLSVGWMIFSKRVDGRKGDRVDSSGGLRGIRLKLGKKM